jgi:dolichol-phosphate mannosyltransferase
MDGHNPLISIVIPCYNESAIFDRARPELTELADSLKNQFNVELIFIDDGSRDDTWQKIRAFAIADPRVRGAMLSRNFGHQFALTCGYDLARGQAVICMDADLQDPPEIIPRLLEKWREGFDVVLAVRRHRPGEGWFKRATASIFYRLIRVMGGREVRADSGDFRLMSRHAIEALNSMREQHRFIRGMVGWVGFKTTEILYDRRARSAGQTKYSLAKMVRLAVDAIISFSYFPLRVAYWTALLLMLASFGYLCWTLVVHFIFGTPLVQGWASLLVAVVAFGTMNLVCLGLIGEYIGRIYEQAKQRPLYLVRETVGPSTGADSDQPPK